MTSTRRHLLLLAALAAVFPVAVLAEPPQKVKVFVTSTGEQSGYSDPNKDTRDTAKDLKERISESKVLVLAESRDDAAIVLTVEARRTSDMTAGMFGGSARDRTIQVKFEAGEFQTEMSASAQGGSLGSVTPTGHGAWGKAAKKLTKQVEDWAVANRSRLKQP
jgi:hypothetical protein